jgi:hypothetical protein
MTMAAGFNELLGQIDFNINNPGTGGTARLTWSLTATGPATLGVAISQGGCLVGTGTCTITVPAIPGSYSVDFPVPATPGTLSVEFKLDIKGPSDSNTATLNFDIVNLCP